MNDKCYDAYGNEVKVGDHIVFLNDKSQRRIVKVNKINFRKPLYRVAEVRYNGKNKRYNRYITVLTKFHIVPLEWNLNLDYE